MKIELPKENVDDFLKNRSPINEPFKYVEGGYFLKNKNKYSPDPLINYRWNNYHWDDDLQLFIIHPKTIESSIKDIVTFKDDIIMINRCGTIIIDFGVECPGWLEITSPDLNGEITLGTSEYKQQTFANKDAQSTIKTAIPKKYGNTYRLELNKELYEGVRFVFINVNKLVSPFTITEIRLVCQTKPINYEGYFQSNNALLNKIWFTSAYVVRANLLKSYFGSILVERGDRISWTGDAYTAQAASLVAFKNYDFIFENLKFTESHPNGIASYEIYWVFSVIDYYKYSGDINGVKYLLPYVIQRLDWAYDNFNKKPGLLFVGWDERLGAGFEKPDSEENQYIYILISLRAFKEFSLVLKEIGEIKLSDKYYSRFLEKTEELKNNKNWYQNLGIHAAADCINAEILDDNEVQALYHKHFDDRVNRVSYSPFNEYFLINAMAKSHHYDDAISAILDLWGGMINYGATTLFEVYRPEWNKVLNKNGAVPNCQVGYTSLAHPWGAGVLKWLSEEILGIKPLSPGFSTFQIKPHFGRQLYNVNGITPTKYGNICFSINTKTGKAKLTVPKNTKCNLAIPKVEKQIKKITINGEDSQAINEDDSYVYLSQLSSGKYRLEISYSGETPKYKEIEYSYSIKSIQIDKETNGNWIGKYGKDGYLLCGFEQKLPNYIDSISFPTFPLITPPELQLWSGNSNRKEALQKTNGKMRNIGCYHSHKFANCGQSIVLDIKVKSKTPYCVTLYFCDWEKMDRITTIDVFDGDTHNLIAPVKLIKRFKSGVYVIYKYNNSIRFRIHAVKGDNAAISAIFFDTNK